MKLSRHLFALILLLCCINFSWAQAAPAPAPKTVVIHAGRLLDVKTGKTLTNQTIIIQGDKISQVGGIRDQLLSKDATVIELPNATVLPGLIDAHTHVTFTTNFGYSQPGDFHAARGAHWSTQCPGHARSRVYDHSQRGRRRLTPTWTCAMPSMPAMFRDRTCW